LSDEIAASFSFQKGHRISFEMMLQALAIPKNVIKALSTAQKQTQFDYVKQRILEQTGEIWEWRGAPKDGEWVKVDDATIAAPSIEKPLPFKGLSDTIAATAKHKITYKLNRDGSVILRSLVGTSIKVLKRMSDIELKAIGIFRTLIGTNEKFFPIDPDAIAATAKPKSTKKQADRRFTLQEAVDFYNSAHPSDRPLKANSLKQNAKMYGFMIKERGSGMYALIDS
jgi:hypothetical protein